MIGITGTNGKTTTTELTGAIFRDARLPVAVGGNIGHALAAMPGEVAPDATVVAELSSFQLEHIERFRPAVAVLLNLTEDHLDRHGTYRAYVDAKLRIFENQTADDVALLCADDDGILAELAAGRLAGARRAAGSPPCPGAPRGPAAKSCSPASASDDVLWLHVRGELRRLCRRDELALRGDHNLLNSLAAAAAACAAGAPVSAAAVSLRTFEGVPHRLQVGSVVDGVSYVNDSKATNVDATLKALTAYSGDVHLILGGYDKGAEYGELAAATEGRVKQALLIGATAPQLEAAFAAARDRGRSTADSVRPLRRPRGRRARRGCLRRAGRRRPAQPGVRELGPVQGLRAAGRTFPETGERPENEELRPREVVRTRGRARRSRPPRLGRGRAAAYAVGRGPPVRRAAERVGPGPGPGATRHRAPLGGAARSCRLLDRAPPRVRPAPPRVAPPSAAGPRVARRSRRRPSSGPASPSAAR